MAVGLRGLWKLAVRHQWREAGVLWPVHLTTVVVTVIVTMAVTLAVAVTLMVIVPVSVDLVL